MTGKDLFEGMSWVDERFVDEAEHAALPKPRVIPWIKIASMAACLCVILFGLHDLRLDSDEGIAAGQDSEGSMAQGAVEDEMKDESDLPEDSPSREVPSVILYVDDMTDLGFTGTVTQLVDTDVFEIGMELNVVVEDDTRHENADNIPSTSADSTTDYTGRYVMVQFIAYNRETATIVVDLISEVPAEKG